MKTGDRIKHSHHSIQPLRHAWLICGRSDRKPALKQALDDRAAERGTILEEVQGKAAKFFRIKWDNGTESDTLPYMVEAAR